jgi:carbamoyl-phosphate synthase large subunit
MPIFFRDCDKKGWPFPLVVKGVFYDARCGRGEEAESPFARSRRNGECRCAAAHHGEECNLAGVGDGTGAARRVMMRSAHHRTRKAWAGISIHFQTKSWRNARRLVAALKWKGPIEIEVMRDSQGAYQLIEINPRFPAWIYLSQGVGRNLPALLLSLALDEAPPPLAPPRPGMLFIRYAQETIVPLSSFENLMVEGRSQLESEKP